MKIVGIETSGKIGSVAICDCEVVCKEIFSGSLTLGKGKHKIKIKYFDGGGAVLRLSWIKPGEKVANSIEELSF